MHRKNGIISHHVESACSFYSSAAQFERRNRKCRAEVFPALGGCANGHHRQARPRTPFLLELPVQVGFQTLEWLQRPFALPMLRGLFFGTLAGLDHRARAMRPILLSHRKRIRREPHCTSLRHTQWMPEIGLMYIALVRSLCGRAFAWSIRRVPLAEPPVSVA